MQVVSTDMTSKKLRYSTGKTSRWIFFFWQWLWYFNFRLCVHKPCRSKRNTSKQHLNHTDYQFSRCLPFIWWKTTEAFLNTEEITVHAVVERQNLDSIISGLIMQLQGRWRGGSRFKSDQESGTGGGVLNPLLLYTSHYFHTPFSI